MRELRRGGLQVGFVGACPRSVIAVTFISYHRRYGKLVGEIDLDFNDVPLDLTAHFLGKRGSPSQNLS